MEQVGGAGMTEGSAAGSEGPGPMPASHRGHDHEPAHLMADHVLTRIGLQVTVVDGRPRFDLPVDPLLLDAEGHLDVGVLGVYLDLAAGQAVMGEQDRPWVHADITAHRLAAPVGRLLTATTTAVRMGGRSGVVEVEVHDDAGTHIARSVQEIVFTGAARLPDPPLDRSRFYELFHRPCSLDAPLADVLSIAPAGDGGDGDGPAWTIPLTDGSRNGFGGLHGGVTMAVVGTAALGAVRHELGATGWVLSASVRYLAPSLVGPFRATPRLVTRRGDVALVAVELRDPGMEDRLTVLADVHVTLA